MLKLFVNDLHYLQHLDNLRHYFFLLDGEFGRNVSEGLFKKLYSANTLTDVINGRYLQLVMHSSLDRSLKTHDFSDRLSFKINELPKVFDLSDPDVFDCISLTYTVSWPLNVLLPSETISKYDKMFKFVLKLHRVAWVLQLVFQVINNVVLK